jgi:hypothetical protein
LSDLDKNEPTAAEARQQLLSALLASDLAVEVSAVFNGRRSVGFSVPAATAHVFATFRAALGSPQDGPVVLIALAALQLREGHVQPVIRDAALDLIDTGEAINAYRSQDAGQRKATRQMVEQLESLLKETDVQQDEES